MFPENSFRVQAFSVDRRASIAEVALMAASELFKITRYAGSGGILFFGCIRDIHQDL